MRQAALWVGTILVVTAIDLGVRFGMPFELQRVLRVEAVLFAATSLVLFVLYRRNPRATGRLRTFQVVLIVAFAMAGIRAAIWGAGRPVFWANMIALMLAAVFIGVLIIRRRGRRSKTTRDETPSQTPITPER